MKENPPCYRCVSLTPLPAGVNGLCRNCAAEVGALRHRQSSQAICPKCALVFYDDWERIQHVVNGRHNYLSWTEEQGRAQAEKMNPRGTA